MSATAADVVDRVLPEVPLRQWVLSVPFALRVRLAADPAMLTAVSRVLWEEMRRWYRAASGLTTGDGARVEAGAITFVQRFGGALNLNVHFHVVAADGAWRCLTDGSTPVFVPVRAPTRDDLAGVVARVVARVAKAFARTTGDEADGAADDALAGCQRAALARGSYGVVRDDGAVEASEATDTARFGRRPPKAQVAETEGFNLHASVVIGAKDGAGRERLLRYTARPAVALDRVSELSDGRIAWRLKQPERARGDASDYGADGVHGAPRGAGPATAASAGALPRGVRAQLPVARGRGAGAAPAGAGASDEGLRREGGGDVCGCRGGGQRSGGAGRDDRRRDLERR
jgi:hypothetical protein